MMGILMQGVDFITWITQPPGSTIFIFLLAVIVNTISSFLSRLLTDPTELGRKQAIIKEHQEKKKELEKFEKENPHRYATELIRWKRREKAVQKMQQNMSLSRLKPQCLTFIPMIIIVALLNGIYNPSGLMLPVALPAMNPAQISFLGDYVGATKLGGWINFFTWYFLCSFGASSVIQRLFGVAQQSSLSQMLGGGQQGSGFSTKGLFRKKPLSDFLCLKHNPFTSIWSVLCANLGLERCHNVISR